MKISFLIIALLCNNFFFTERSIFLTNKGKVSFESNAPLELIKAKSNKLKGAIDTKNNTFAFSINIDSFNGFNNPLQREHFQENYLESDKIPKAIFTGKIIEDINWKKNGKHEIRAKGKLQIHGIERERIIKSDIRINNDRIHINAKFTVLLAEHAIDIPKIVHQKIAKEIKVKIEAELNRK